MLTVLIIYCALLGLIVGSFLNVVIYRVPRHLSIVRPRSACPRCSEPITPRDNIPVLSWLILRGRCRNCGEPISPRYPLIELTTAILFAGTAARVGYRADLPALLVLVAGLVALGLIDAEFLILPKRIVYVVLALQVVTLVGTALDHGQWHRLAVAVLVSAIWYVFFFTMNAVSPRALGFGDVRLSLVLGLGLGWLGIGYALLGFFVANFAGAMIGLTLIAAKRMSRRQPITYGVFLAIGTYIAIFAGPELLAPFQNLQWHF